MKHISNTIAIFILLFAININLAQEYDPVADTDAIVISDNVRFTVLTPRVIRMEWAEDGVFEDHATLVFINRKLPVPDFKKLTQNGWLSIETDAFNLKYKLGSGKFADNNLQIKFTVDGTNKLWRPGTENRGNLSGTARTLDGYDGNINYRTKEEIDLGQGIISKDGWVLIDDSERPIFDNSEWPWVMPRPEKEKQDLYFFCYGFDYKTALNDFINIAGKIALPPKYVFGAWWSRYWEYTDWELRELIQEFEIHDVPLDVLVVDMDWHITTKPEWYQNGEKIQDQAGQWAGWTGFTWNRNYFPDPNEFLKWTDKNGLRVCMNLHPASGIQPHEEKYQEIAKAMGIDPKTGKYVPFDIVNKDFAKSFMKIILHPMEAAGVDFWWLDWQQWSTTKIPGVNPTFYLNYVFFSDMERRNEKRSLIFHRYGGLGNHRYQIGFSGDAFINWRSLDFQPYFTATASNVGFGFWSHDIGGHMFGESNPELYTRWIQFGIFSPILRTHCTKNPRIERRIWAYPLEYFSAMRSAFHLRYSLIPYIYTAARQAYDTGISICRPMYYDYPEAEEAYAFKNQYMFGEDILVAPITRSIGNDSLFVLKEIWLPEGDWIEFCSGTVFKGGRVIKRAFALDEIPLYVREGSIIPMQPKMKRTDEKPINPLILNIFPGKTGSTSVYDDEGNNQNYKAGTYAITNVTFKKIDHEKINIRIEPVKGSFPGMLLSRAYELRLPLTLPPEEVKVNGKTIKYARDSNVNSWNYDGNELSTHIFTPESSVRRKVEVEIEFPEYDVTLLSGKKGEINKLLKFIKFLADNNWDKSKYSNDLAVHVAQTGHRISLNPDDALLEIQQFDKEWQQVLEMIETYSQEQPNYVSYLELLKTSNLK
ncbi:MAG: TIM-barrel domain-containing protein [Candidatus Neomarinimicrobiota bacterium]